MPSLWTISIWLSSFCFQRIWFVYFVEISVCDIPSLSLPVSYRFSLFLHLFFKNFVSFCFILFLSLLHSIKYWYDHYDHHYHQHYYYSITANLSRAHSNIIKSYFRPTVICHYPSLISILSHRIIFWLRWMFLFTM